MNKNFLLQFDGLNAPLLVKGENWVLDLLRAVLPKWPFEAIAEGSNPHFAELTQNENGTLTFKALIGEEESKAWDPVNAICDLISEMAWEQLRSNPDYLCLHAAAIEFNDRLVVFPNARRAGKSTLAIALGQTGRRLFTDDFLPIEIDPKNGRICGLANGISPRLRLPNPVDFSDALTASLQQAKGPANKQYKYLQDIPLAHHGEGLPIGAIVVLDRQDNEAAPLLEPISREVALVGIIRQNFSRDMHAARILHSLDAIGKSVPIFQLSYSNAERAADFLNQAEQLKMLPAAKSTQQSDLPRTSFEEYRADFQSAVRYMQVPGLSEVELSGKSFVADANGQGIYELNAGSAAIWRILAEPENVETVVDILLAAFPGTDAQQVRADSKKAMKRFHAARLIQPSR